MSRDAYGNCRRTTLSLPWRRSGPVIRDRAREQNTGVAKLPPCFAFDCAERSDSGGAPVRAGIAWISPLPPLLAPPWLARARVPTLLDAGSLAPYRILHLLSLLHFALTDRDLLLHDRSLLNSYLLLGQWNADLIIFSDVTTRRASGGWMPLDDDLLASDGHVDGLFVGDDFLANPDLPSLHALL